MNESNYVTDIPAGTKIKKIYFEGSPYAQIWLLDNGEFYVQKMTTLVLFKARSYRDAEGMRRMIADRCRGIDFELERDRS